MRPRPPPQSQAMANYKRIAADWIELRAVAAPSDEAVAI